MTDAEAQRIERARADETKPALRTTEFYIYLAPVGAVLIASWLVGEGDGDRDWFRSDRAWFYITLLTIGYLISRGLAEGRRATGRRPTANGHRDVQQADGSRDIGPTPLAVAASAGGVPRGGVVGRDRIPRRPIGRSRLIGKSTAVHASNGPPRHSPQRPALGRMDLTRRG